MRAHDGLLVMMARNLYIHHVKCIKTLLTQSQVFLYRVVHKHLTGLRLDKHRFQYEELDIVPWSWFS